MVQELRRPKGKRSPVQEPRNNELEFLKEIKEKLERERGPLTRDWLKKKGYSKRFIDTVLSL